MAHLKGVQGSVPFTGDETAQGKVSLLQRLSVGATSGAISGFYVQELPPNYYRHAAQRVDAVTKYNPVSVARTYIDLDHLEIVIVDDRAPIEEPLRAAGIAPIVRLDLDGNPIPNGTP